MELFILPMSCSFAAHVACLEAGLSPTLRHVTRATKELEDGSDYRAISPLGLVPVIREDDGFVFGESAAVLQYIADRAPERQLAPEHGSRARHVLAQWLNFVSTEVHKSCVWILFSTTSMPEQKAWARDHAVPVLEYLARHLATRTYVMGDVFTVADTYLWWTLFVMPHGGLSLEPYPALRAYVERIRARPSVGQALAYEVPLFQRERAAAAPAPAP